MSAEGGVGEGEQPCGCWTCCEGRGERPWWMVVCASCGNKRCPHATDHRLDCTGSNESGQAGSAYEHGSGAASARRGTLPPLSTTPAPTTPTATDDGAHGEGL